MHSTAPSAGVEELIPFTESDKNIRTKAVHDAGILCHATARVLARYVSGSSPYSEGAERSKLSSLLFEAFHIGKHGRSEPNRVITLSHRFTGIAHIHRRTTYQRLKETPRSSNGEDTIACTGHEGAISLSPVFFDYKPHERAIILIHEGVHRHQNIHNYNGPRDVLAKDAINRVSFDDAINYPYLFQYFLSKLFNVTDPSMVYNGSPLNVTAQRPRTSSSK